MPGEGNVNRNGNKIYHVKGWRDPAKVRLKLEEGDICFQTVLDAELAGFRRPHYADEKRAVMKDLFLMQHGRAMTENDDPRRPLSAEGAEAVTKMSAWARDAGIHVQQIRHSDKLRAQQTAQIVADNIKITGGVNRVSGLGPNDDVNPIARSIQIEVANLMLVGHLPFLSRIVGFLVSGDPEVEVVRFYNAGIVCLREKHGTWSVGWVMTPELLV